MINREIVYERNLTGSFMKIPESIHAGLDERLMLRKKLPGLLSVEKTFLDGRGWYWYNISGKQSLDTYCRVKDIGLEFIERLIISICSQMEILEWNLIHTNCLVLDPELVFLSNCNREFIFTIYPDNNEGIEKEFQHMMEYLLTKVDHKDMAVVQLAYGIYEKTLTEGYSIVDIRDELIKAKTETTDRMSRPEKQEKQVIENKYEREVLYNKKQQEPSEKTEETTNMFQTCIQQIKDKLVYWGVLEPDEKKVGKKKKEKRKRKNKVGKKEKETVQRPVDVVFPEDEIIETEISEVHPTVCLNNIYGKQEGILYYLGNDKLEDIHMEKKCSYIGYGVDADIQIAKETISGMHAKIDWEKDEYYIEDLNSTNGTFVNNEPLSYKERRKLSNNDIVRFADIRYRFG